MTVASLQENLFQWMVRLIVLFTAMPVHECAHGYVADKLGDNTARLQGRLTLNPFAHLDPMGSICLLLFGFGWAKPVPVNSRYFAKPKRDMALTAIAGPVSNILLAFIVMVALKICYGISPLFRHTAVLSTLVSVLSLMIILNLYLAVFNLLPIPPLDGSKFFGAALPGKAYYFMLRYERYVYIVLVILLFTGVLSLPLQWLAQRLFGLLDWMTTPINLFFR